MIEATAVAIRTRSHPAAPSISASMARAFMNPLLPCLARSSSFSTARKGADIEVPRAAPWVNNTPFLCNMRAQQDRTP
jgi:hypothetical protein